MYANDPWSNIELQDPSRSLNNKEKRSTKHHILESGYCFFCLLQFMFLGVFSLQAWEGRQAATMEISAAYFQVFRNSFLAGG